MKELIKQQPMPGDVIYASRGLYKHYGIYIGNGRVVHFAALGGNELDASKAEIVETSLAEFLKGADLAVSIPARFLPLLPMRWFGEPNPVWGAEEESTILFSTTASILPIGASTESGIPSR